MDIKSTLATLESYFILKRQEEGLSTEEEEIAKMVCELMDYYESDEVQEWVDFPSPDPYEMVLEFHEKFGLRTKDYPHMPDRETRLLWSSLLEEEYTEYVFASIRKDLPAITDALADIIYIAYGVAIAHGIDLRPIFAEVHRTNMAKEGGGTREDGKILKPEGWEPPRIEDLLREQGREERHENRRG